MLYVSWPSLWYCSQNIIIITIAINNNNNNNNIIIIIIITIIIKNDKIYGYYLVQDGTFLPKEGQVQIKNIHRALQSFSVHRPFM